MKPWGGPAGDDEPAVRVALERAGGIDVVGRLERSLATQLGTTWGGTDLSGGQRQKLALGRAMMRQQPLLLILDEPTASLDAEAEHALFARYVQTARRAASQTGTIAVLVSHRFSTVRMADLIVVLDGGRVREVGSHEELLAADRAAAQSAVDQARASLAKLTNGATPATLDLNQARIHQADVQVSEAEQALKDAELIAPADGVVTDLNITLGEPSTTGTTSSSATPASAITVADLSSLHFETSDLDEVGAAKVYLGEPVKVYLGEPVKVTVAVLNKQTFDGTVTDVALQPTITSSGDVNYTAEISLKDLPPGLRWGRTAQVEFLPTK